MNREELKKIQQRTRKLITRHKALYPGHYVDRLYVSRNEGGRGLAIVEDIVDASMHEGGLITAIRNDTDNTKTNGMTITGNRK